LNFCNPQKGKFRNSQPPCTTPSKFRPSPSHNLRNSHPPFATPTKFHSSHPKTLTLLDQYNKPMCHCGRPKVAKQSRCHHGLQWIASSLTLLAMTSCCVCPARSAQARGGVEFHNFVRVGNGWWEFPIFVISVVQRRVGWNFGCEWDDERGISVASCGAVGYFVFSGQS